MYAFVPNKSFRNEKSFIRNFSNNFIPLKTFNLEFQAIAVWFADQNGHPLEKEDKINLTSVIT